MKQAVLYLVVPLVVALAVSCGGSDPAFIECRDDQSCDRFDGGRCVLNPDSGHKFCAYPDAVCETGMRWSDLDVEEAISGMCVAEAEPDAGVDAPDGGETCTDGLIVFVSDRQGTEDLFWMEGDGTGLLKIDVESEPFKQSPRFAPDGMKVAFGVIVGGKDEIYVANVDGSNLINVSNSTNSDHDFEWSPDSSRLVYESTDAAGDAEIYVVNADGTGRMNLTNNAALDRWPSWSPDGTKIAFSARRDGNFEIYAMNPDGASPVNLTTSSPEHETRPRWSPDGAKIAFISQPGLQTTFSLWTMDADGTNQVNATNDDLTPRENFFWSPDSSWIAYQLGGNGGDDDDISIVRPDGTGKAPVVNDTANDVLGGWSPDGNRLYFTSDRDGNTEVYTIHPDTTGAVNKTSNAASDTEPHWIGCP
jgi:TolB protein